MRLRRVLGSVEIVGNRIKGQAMVDPCRLLETRTFTYVSPSVEHLRGWTPDKALALSLEQTLSPASLAMVNQALAGELALENTPGADPDRSRTVEIENSCKDGSRVWVEARVSLMLLDAAKDHHAYNHLRAIEKNVHNAAQLTGKRWHRLTWP